SVSSPRAHAPPSVPSSSVSPADRTLGRCARARADSSTLRSSSKKSKDGADAGLSVPTPTRAPTARSSANGATPQPSAPFERGQWATPRAPPPPPHAPPAPPNRAPRAPPPPAPPVGAGAGAHARACRGEQLDL